MTHQVSFVTGGSGFIGQHLVRALVADGQRVRALARSERAAGCLRALGAEPVSGDLADRAVLGDALTGCSQVFHLAGVMHGVHGEAEMHRVNVDGTLALLEAAKSAGVAVFVHLSTTAVHCGGGALVDADEGRPLPTKPLGPYARTKANAEHLVRAANGQTRTVIVRAPLVWGPGDTNTLPQLVENVRLRRFSWIDGGHYAVSTCHVLNLVAGLRLAAERGVGGAAYFVTDGPAREFRIFLSELLRASGVEPPTRQISRAMVSLACAMFELPWKVLPLRSEPPTHLREVVETLGQSFTVSDAKARRELGYAPVISLEAGMEALRREHGRGELSSKGFGL